MYENRSSLIRQVLAQDIEEFSYYSDLNIVKYKVCSSVNICCISIDGGSLVTC